MRPREFLPNLPYQQCAAHALSWQNVSFTADVCIASAIPSMRGPSATPQPGTVVGEKCNSLIAFSAVHVQTQWPALSFLPHLLQAPRQRREQKFNDATLPGLDLRGRRLGWPARDIANACGYRPGLASVKSADENIKRPGERRKEESERRENELEEKQNSKLLICLEQKSL